MGIIKWLKTGQSLPTDYGKLETEFNVVGTDTPLPVDVKSMVANVDLDFEASDIGTAVDTALKATAQPVSNAGLTDLETSLAGATEMVGSVPGASVGTASSPTLYSGTFEDTIDVNAALGRNGNQGFIRCDGPGELRVGLSTNGTTSMLTTEGTTSTVLCVPANQSIDLDGLSIDTIKIDATVAGTLYEVKVW